MRPGRTGRLKETLEQGGVALGAGTLPAAPAFIEVYGALGLDFVWLDFEHAGPSPYDSPALENLARTAETAGIELLVRLPTGDPPVVRSVLDTGIRNIFISRVDSADEVERAVRATKFTVDGEVAERGIAKSRASDWGARLDETYPETENDSTVLGVMIETEAAVENLEEILSVPELGFVFVGPGDLSASLGRPTETDHRDVQTLVADVETAALEAGVPFGRAVVDEDGARAAIERGCQLLRIGTSIDAARAVIGDRLDAIRNEPE